MFALICFSVYHLLWESAIVGVVCGINALMMGVVLIKNIRAKYAYWPQNIIVIVMTCSIICTTYEQGFRGLVYVFPFIVSLFFHLSFRSALFTSLILTVFCLLAALNTISLKVTLLLSVPIIITITLSIMYAIAVAKHKQELEFEAKQDYLTGIVNRRSIMCWLNLKIEELSFPTSVSIFYIDIDDFKRINDTYGNTVGDEVLQEVSNIIQRVVKPTLKHEYNITGPIEIARIASDEFVLANVDVHTNQQLNNIATVLMKSICEPMCIRGNDITINVSIGVSSSKVKNDDSNHLMVQADQAMHKAKSEGKNKIIIFDAKLAEELELNNLILKSLKSAITEQSFFLTFMPIYNNNADIVGAETLIRSQNNVLSQYGPDKYIPIAEKMGLIKEIDIFVIEQSFIKMQMLQPKILGREFTLAINISAQELRNKDFPNQVAALAKHYQITPQHIEFEITETSLVDHDRSSTKILVQLKNQGFKISLDDFGTGYTAFNQLQHYPVDTLKIDRQFVNDITTSEQTNGSMIDVILSLANLYKLNVIAEGVEEQYQMDYLIARNCAQYQGYLLSKPISWEKLIAMLD